MGMCSWEYKYLQSPEEVVRFSGVGITDLCEPLDVGIRNKPWSTARVESPLNHRVISPAPIFFSIKDKIVNVS